MYNKKWVFKALIRVIIALFFSILSFTTLAFNGGGSHHLTTAKHDFAMAGKIASI